DAGSAWRLVLSGRKDIPVFQALRDISFEVPKGKFAGILGRNGAGKSTLLRVIGGAYTSDKGSISISGDLSALYELGVVANPELTGRQYADRLLTVNRFPKDARKAMIDDIHEFSELGSRFDDPVLTYSAGMGARLYFATATAGDYSVYLLDEVLSVGDQHFQAKCWRRLRERVSAGASGILVTHDWAAVLKLCEKAYVLDTGKIAFEGPAEQATRYYLYGETQQESPRSGTARFLKQPEYPQKIAPGDDFLLRADIEILQPADVGMVFTIERLQPGFGWEISMMSRDVQRVGSAVGRYAAELRIPRIPLDPGQYFIGAHLVASAGEGGRERISLDGFGWLNGTGLPLEVLRGRAEGLSLSTIWSVGAS
ncbi:MAG: ABC transporter ATP-binding protein, partial [Rhizomicrobium sp.]